MWQCRWNTASWGHFSLRVSWVLCHFWANRVGVWFLVWFSFLLFLNVFFPSTLPRRYQKDVLGVEITPFLVGVSTAAKLSSVNTSKEHTAQYCVYYSLLRFWNVSVSWVFLPTVLFGFVVCLFLWFIYLLVLVWFFVCFFKSISPCPKLHWEAGHCCDGQVTDIFWHLVAQTRMSILISFLKSIDTFKRKGLHHCRWSACDLLFLSVNFCLRLYSNWLLWDGQRHANSIVKQRRL